MVQNGRLLVLVIGVSILIGFIPASGATVEGDPAGSPAAAAPEVSDDGTISGTITDSETAAGVVGERVLILDDNGEVVTTVWTDVLGFYITILGIPPGTYRVQVSSNNGYLGELYDDIPCATGCESDLGTPVVVGPGEAVSGIDFVVDKGATISGTVVDARDGSGIRWVDIEISDPDGRSITTAASSISGTYTGLAGLPTGTYFARTVDTASHFDQLYSGMACDPDCDVTLGTPIMVSGTNDTGGIDFTLEPRPVLVDGFESGDTDAWSATTNDI